MTFDRMGKRTVTVTLTVAQAEAIREVCNSGIINGNDDSAAERRNETARRGLERMLIARGYKPQRIAGMVGFATIDGRGSLS